MPKFIISQGPTQHSRIGNSLLWMQKLPSFAKRFDAEYLFPWAMENYSNYLDSASPWLKGDSKFQEFFIDNFGLELNGINIAQTSRSLESKYETKKSLSSFQWQFIVDSVIPGELLFVSGKIDLRDGEIQNEIANHKYIIFHEPFDYIFPEISDAEEGFLAIAPRADLVDRELAHILSMSPGAPFRVGLHVRRGDYFKWRNGDFFYPDEVWLKISQLKNSKQASVWVFSNDLQKDSENKMIENHAIISKGSFEQDFIRLMLMDEIYGPPSTFTIMASQIAEFKFKKKIKVVMLPPISNILASINEFK